MSETTETHYCFYHPNTPTSLRCNRCGKYICVKDARLTPVGYRCKDCVRAQQDVYFNSQPADYVITAVITLPLSYVAGSIVPSLFWLAIFAGPIVGGVIAEIVRIATHKRRGRYTWLVAVGCLTLGTLIPLWPSISIVLIGALSVAPQLGGNFLINVGLDAVYLVFAAGTIAARLRYG